MMDLGATICTPRNPSCRSCPLRQFCKAALLGRQETYPIRIPKPEKPLRRGAAFVAVRGDLEILLRKRPDSGLLGGMSEVPTTHWNARQDGAIGTAALSLPGDWRKAGIIRHVFTHFALELEVWRLDLDASPTNEGWWAPLRSLERQALPSVMKKAIEAAIPGVFAAKSNSIARKRLQA